MSALTLHATLKRVTHDEDGESVVQFRIPASDLSTCVGLAALHNTLLRLTVRVDDATLNAGGPTPKQFARCQKLLESLGLPESEWRDALNTQCGKTRRRDLTQAEMSEFLTALEQLRAAQPR